MKTLLAAAVFALMATAAHADFFSDNKEQIVARNAALVEIYHEYCEGLPQAFIDKHVQALKVIQPWMIPYQRERMRSAYLSDAPMYFCPGLRPSMQQGLEEAGFSQRLQTPWRY